MNAKLDPTLIPAFDAIFGTAPAPRAIDKRQLLNSMQRMDHEMRLRHYPAVMESQPNPADTCDCGAEAEHTEWRNGREIGVCASCK